MNICLAPCSNHNSRPRLLLLFLPQGQQAHSRYFHHLEPDTGNVTLRLTLPTETRKQDLIVLIHKVKTTVIWYERSDFLAVLDELHTHAFADGRVGLLGFDTDFLEDDAFGVGGAAEG
jgi:hypothetical protein